MGLFVDPDHSGQLLHHFLYQLLGLIFGVGFEIENQDVLSTEALAPRVYKLAGAKENFNSWIFFLLFLSFVAGLLLLGFFLALTFLDFLDAFAGFLVFFVLFGVGQCLAVFLNKRRYFLAV